MEQQEAAFEAVVDGASEETIKMYADKFKPDLPKSTTLPDDDEYCDDQDQDEGSISVMGDEVKWLENLWKLEDGRKKKK